MKKLLFLILFYCSYAFADTNLTQYLKNMRSLQADFSQTVIDKKGKALQQSRGHMALQRPSQFRWEVKSPTAQLIVTNGKRLWIYDPDLEQVTIRPLAKTAGETPVLLLSNENLGLEKDFVVRSLPQKNSEEWFLLRPKDKQSMVSSLKLGFAKGEIREMQLQDHLGHTTFIRFSNVKLNLALASQLFIFKIPPRVDVIDETQQR